ncbi:MAG TPA: cytochrome c oxidase subunit II [Candidatus Dormibacteraeota bacterium]|nr:cytochrome c oxidase subunit II [Candidatus Dormibacteraeota bacterium]
MDFNQAVLTVFIVGAALIVAAMAAVALTSGGAPQPQSEVQPRGYALRRRWFWALAAATVLALIISLPHLPYPSASAMAADMHVTVTAQQYGFTLPAELPRGRPIIFDVTSRDVNHGFGIYGPDGRLIGQVQAMPDYVNHLPFTFTVPGHYTIRCLEYCGVGHAYMQASFEVK